MNTLTWLTRLVEFDTTSHRSNLSLIADIQNWMAHHHIPIKLIHDPIEPKANLFATLPAADGKTDGGIVLSGHTDVVPVVGQQWNTNPFTAVPIGDKIFGRGTCDMKGFIAVVLALIPEWKAMALPFPIHFAFSYDEEVGCRGAPLIIAEMQQSGIKPNACIVGEPTEMRPVVAHKGIQVFRVQLRGLAAHSSLTTKGCNTIEYASRLICQIRNLAESLKQEGPFDSHFDVPFSTVTTNLIQGGTALNIIPAECEFHFEFRNLPNINPKIITDRIMSYAEELLPVMRQEYPEAMISINNIAAVPGFQSSENSRIETLSRDICNHHDIHKVAYATEAGLFELAHIPTIVCGPGNIEQAHRENEFVTLQQLQQCENYLRELIRRNITFY